MVLGAPNRSAKSLENHHDDDSYTHRPSTRFDLTADPVLRSRAPPRTMEDRATWLGGDLAARSINNQMGSYDERKRHLQSILQSALDILEGDMDMLGDNQEQQRNTAGHSFYTSPQGHHHHHQQQQRQ